MSTLALVLMAAMAVPGNGPASESDEIRVNELRLEGEWLGQWWTPRCKGEKVRFRDHHNDPVVIYDIPKFGAQDCLSRFRVIDESGGHFRVLYGSEWRLGIYRREGDRVMLCFGKNWLVRPTVFQAGEDRWLLILRRVKPGK